MRHHPIAALRLLGGLVVCAGLLVVAIGVRDAAERASVSDPFHGEAAQRLADAVSWVTWGVMIFTIGCYVWRAARQHGTRDRLGRLLIVCGYLLLGVALDKTVHAAVAIWSVSGDDSSVLLDVMKHFLGWGVPAAFLVWLGAKLANEKVITTASMDVSSR